MFGSNVNSKVKLYNKIAATKQAVFSSSTIINTHEFCMKVAEFLAEPDSDNEAFIPYHDIEDTYEKREPRFNIIFSTKLNLRKLKSDRLLQTDATYRLNWMGFPVYVVGN